MKGTTLCIICRCDVDCFGPALGLVLELLVIGPTDGDWREWLVQWPVSPEPSWLVWRGTLGPQALLQSVHSPVEGGHLAGECLGHRLYHVTEFRHGVGHRRGGSVPLRVEACLGFGRAWRGFDLSGSVSKGMKPSVEVGSSCHQDLLSEVSLAAIELEKRAMSQRCGAYLYECEPAFFPAEKTGRTGGVGDLGMYTISTLH